MQKVKVATENREYTIEIKTGLLKELPDVFKERYSGKKLGLLCDSNTQALYGDGFADELKARDFDVTPLSFPAGEGSKNLDTLAGIYDSLAAAGFTRSDYLVALGGGVTGDMGGLAAATFLRGMGFIQIPTTLLAMVDSSIGGKVAVDLPRGKNLVGAFYQPYAVYTDPELLSTLNDRQFADGMAELIKHGFIRDEKLYKELTDLGSRKAVEPNLDRLIKKSCKIKRDVVEKDEKDNGIRQLLNFGHTLGHAIEKAQNFTGMTHGEAISAGMVYITAMTEKIGLTRDGETERVKKALSLFGLPVDMPDVPGEALVEAVRIDKKARSGKITLAIIDKIGSGTLHDMYLAELEERILGKL